MKPAAPLHIYGGIPLQGTIRASGSKNAALPIMAASLLTDRPLRLRGAPHLRDIDTLARVLQAVGMSAIRDEEDCLVLQTQEEQSVRAPYRHVRQMRASFCVLGPLLARRGRAIVPLPGGCNIGARPVDIHLRGLTALGAEIRLEKGNIVARSSRLRGARVDLTGPRGSSVTATANLISAASLARGTTVLCGAAIEPEIVDLGNCLGAMGARIEGLGHSTVVIRGVDELDGADYQIIPDRIEAATLLFAGAITSGQVQVRRIVPAHLESVFVALETMGCRLNIQKDSATVEGPEELQPLSVAALPYPGFPTDLQPQLTGIMCLANGVSRIRDAVFPERFAHVPELQRLGAAIHRRGDQITIRGPRRLRGAKVMARDLRGSAALVLAGLAAQGETIVEGIAQLERGYERFEEKLRTLGGRVESLRV